MKLATKFGILIGLLGLTMIVSLGAAMLFAQLLERQLREPLDTTASLMGDLSELKGRIGDEADRLFGEAGGQPGRYGDISDATGDAASEPDGSHVEIALSGLIANRALRERFGPTIADNISRRTKDAISLAAAFASVNADDPGRPERAREAAEAHFIAHELIESVERQVIKEAKAQLRHGDTQRSIFYVILAAAMTASGLFALLGSLLFRRWIVRPVRDLRAAAEAIGGGDFSHRVAVTSADELGQLSGEVNYMAGMIASMQQEAVERERLAAVGEMVRRLAHNLRNPLAGIRGLAELTRMRAPDDDAIRNDQTEIITAVDRFNGWLTDLLQATSPLALNPREVATHDWLMGIIESHMPLARMRSVTLETDISKAPATATFDPKHLEHALVAIVTNAIQASPANSKVRFEAATSSEKPEGGAWWEIRVTDEGSGIPSDVMAKIFKPYFTTKRDGNGIGLAVAQSVVKGHGGRIDVRSEPGRGAEFTVRIPTGVNG